MRSLKVAIALIIGCTTGCSSISPIRAITSLASDKPDITAQVGAENTKQGLVYSNKESTKVGDVLGSVHNSKGQQVQSGDISTDRMSVTVNNTTPLLWSFAIGMLSVLGVVFWFVPSPKELMGGKRHE